MAISSSTRKAGPFLGNDATTVFPFAFKVFTTADLLVVNTSSLGVESDLVIDVDYTVTLNSDQDNDPGGSVTLTDALPTGERLTVTSDVAALQPLVLTNNGGFYPRVINDAFDKITIIAQQLIEQVGRSLKLPISSTASATLPDPVANRLIAWNSSANGFTNVDPASIATVAAYADANLELFDGNGTQTAFTLAQDPAVLANLDVSISGVTQVGGEDFTWIGTTLTFLVAPPNGTRIQVRYTRAIPPADLAAAVAAAEADRVATAADRVQTGLDRVATAADVVSAEADRVATAADRVQTGLDAVATAADRVQTGLDRIATAADVVSTADKVAASALAASTGAALVGSIQTGTGATARTVQDKLREIQLTPNDFSGADADAKIAAAAAEAVATGAVLVLPPGTYDIDPITFVDAISVVGAGPNATILRAKTGGTGTLLDFAYNTTGYDSIIGGFTIDLSAAPTMNGLKANNIVRAVVDDVVVKQGAVGIYWMAGGECRFENIYCYDQTTSGFLVDGDNCGEMFYTNILCRRDAAGTTDIAFNIARTTATDTGGHYLTNVRSTRGAGTVNTGIRIGSTVANCAIFALLDRCVTDNTNGTGAGLVLRNLNSVWSVNGYHAGTATNGAVYIYAGQDIQFFGGRADNGAAGKSIHLDSGTIRFSSSNVHLNQGTAYYFTGSGPTAMCNQDILSSGITLTNDTTKLADASTEQRIRSPMSVITDPDGVALRSFTLYDPVNNTNVYMVSANGVWKVYNSGFNEIFTLDNAGSLALNSVLKVAGLQVVGAQGAAVADATGAGDVVAQLNALLARLRTHGLIAT